MSSQSKIFNAFQCTQCIIYYHVYAPILSVIPKHLASDLVELHRDGCVCVCKVGNVEINSGIEDVWPDRQSILYWIIGPVPSSQCSMLSVNIRGSTVLHVYITVCTVCVCGGGGRSYPQPATPYPAIIYHIHTVLTLDCIRAKDCCPDITQWLGIGTEYSHLCNVRAAFLGSDTIQC